MPLLCRGGYEVVAVSRRPPKRKVVRRSRGSPRCDRSVRGLLRPRRRRCRLLPRPLTRLEGLRGARPACADRHGAHGRAAGVHQIVYLGGLGDDDPNLSPHLRAVARPVSACQTVGACHHLVRPWSSVAAAPPSRTILALVDRLPRMVCPRWVSSPTRPIALEDAVRYLAGVCGLDAALGDARRRRPRGRGLIER